MYVSCPQNSPVETLTTKVTVSGGGLSGSGDVVWVEPF